MKCPRRCGGCKTSNSRHFNRRRKRDGTLIRGRFTSKPVRSLVYRRTLVAYIDGNPVKAGLARTSIDYQLGSAHHYARSDGPKWLARCWVEDEVRALAQSDRFSAAAYVKVFGRGTAREADELIAARLASTATDDPLDDLVGAAAERVRAWMQRKATLADGCRGGVPVCGRRALEAALAEDLGTRSAWVVRDDSRLRCGTELARAGLQRDLCGLSWRAIARAARWFRRASHEARRDTSAPPLSRSGVCPAGEPGRRGWPSIDPCLLKRRLGAEQAGSAVPNGRRGVRKCPARYPG